MCPSWIRPQRGLGVAPGSLVITSFLRLQVTTFQSLLGLSVLERHLSRRKRGRGLPLSHAQYRIFCGRGLIKYIAHE